MINYILIFVLLLSSGLAVYYIVRQKKTGAKCIGCPYAKGCKKKKCGNS